MSTFSVDMLDSWYINLERRPDRRELMRPVVKEFHNDGMNLRRFSAFTPDCWSEPKEAAPKLYGTKTAANWMSHTFLMRTVQDTDRDVLILEDDIYLASDFMDRLCYLEQYMTLPWDYIALCGTFHVNPPVWHAEDIGRDVELTNIKHILRAYGVWSNHGYIVRGRSVAKILGLMRSVMPSARGSDHALIMVQPKLNAYVFVPGMVFQRDLQSDVGEGITRFSKFLDMGPYVFQDRLEQFDPDGFNWAEAKQ